MKKLMTVMGSLVIMGLMVTPAFAGTQDVVGGNGSSDPLIPFSEDNAPPFDVYATTSQTDGYRATIAWGTMQFDYDFGTWNVGTHHWDGEGWIAGDFVDTKADITVSNHSSQPLDADFSYEANGGFGSTTTGTFIAEDLNGTNGDTTKDTMTVAFCPEDQVTAPSGKTYLKLSGQPAVVSAALSGQVPAKIGTITVALDTNTTTDNPAYADAAAKIALIDAISLNVAMDEADNNIGDVEDAIKALAVAAINDTDYAVDIAEGSAYTPFVGTTTSGSWTGRITITKTGESTYADGVKIFTVTQDV